WAARNSASGLRSPLSTPLPRRTQPAQAPVAPAQPQLGAKKLPQPSNAPLAIAIGMLIGLVIIIAVIVALL
ncbi:serine/threonine protein kinase, partial [Nocardia cyriacigeorgica]|nr:serine/threonine protein kinase [Nocardia cyriacigeorgica]